MKNKKIGKPKMDTSKWVQLEFNFDDEETNVKVDITEKREIELDSPMGSERKYKECERVLKRCLEMLEGVL